MMAICFRSRSMAMDWMSRPSIEMVPLVTGIRRNRLSMSELLPLPVRPTIPHDVPPLMRKDRFLRTGGRPLR